ncbi:winged helix-turn-helix domain-containing protein [Colwellia sp. 75C3]|uniref:winged helix-turn-helix domain-containing protein n=1 Tax=Colwellia sp. 75C3 TaxID=888425 RepID=UPI0012FF1A12|nr:winged helix-turn-helix domain-containing protein [Colwellia sp. 75C3]
MTNTDFILLGKNILFSPEKNTLTSKSDRSLCVQLENLEAKVLLKLYQAQGETLSKEMLFECWPIDITTSDNSLTRIISNLRKKSKIIEPTLSSLIVNISKKGYHLSNLDSVKEIATPVITSIEKEQLNTKFFSLRLVLSIGLVGSVILLCFILVLLFSAKSISELDEKTKTKIPHYKIAYESKTMKYELSPNENGDTILFSAQALDSPHWLLGIHSIADSTTQYIKRQGTALTSPIWLTDNTVAFKNVKDGQCWIEKIALTALLADGIGETMTNCSINSPTFSMIYNGNNGLLVTESFKESIPANLRLINIENGEQTEVKTAEKGGAGIYKVVTNKDNTLVALLSNNDWFATHISIYENNNFNEELWSTTVELPLYSVALFTSKIKYKDNYGGITTVHFNDNGEPIDTVKMPIIQPFKAVTRFNNGIIFNEGEFYSQNLVMHGLHSDISTEITTEKGIKNNIPYQFDNEHLWYASNRTGISQIWSYNQNTQQHQQISDFKGSLSIKSMSADKDANIAAISTQKGILIFNLDSQYRFGEFIVHVEGSHPTLTANKLVFTGKTTDSYNLFSYQLSSGDITQLTTHGGYNPLINGDELFFENYHKFGIWTLSATGSETLLIPLSFELSNWFYFDDTFYLYDPSNKLYTFNTVNNQLAESELNSGCNRVAYLIEEQCIKVQNEKFANQMVILDE